MYDTAKKAREAMKSKARRLATEKTGKVSSSDWTPPEELHADVKTGARPISRRAYKSGGKVDGSCGPMRADRKPRKAGGKAESEKAEAKQYAIAKVNRNVKEANEQREGIKHVGGFKKGGRTKKEEGGSIESMIANMNKTEAKSGARKNVPTPPPRPADRTPAVKNPAPAKPNMKHQIPGDYATNPRGYADQRKSGGRTKKMMGGGMFNPAGGMMGGNPQMAQNDPRMGMVKPTAMDFAGNPVLPGVSPMKKGGKVKHADEAMDKALIKKMVKPEARAKRADGGRGKQIKMSEGEKEYGKGETPLDRAVGEIRRKFTPEYFADIKKKKQEALDRDPEYQEYKARRAKRESDKSMDDAGYKKGGKVHADEAMDKALIKKMVKPEARTARKDGGRTKSKGKTNIAIVINAGPKGGMPADGMGAPPIVAGPTDGLPIPVPPPKGAMPAGGAMPMPMPMPMPAPAPGGAAGAPPVMRKEGGRITKKASSYKDMEAGAGSGEGRLQKTDIAAKIPKPGLKRGVIVDDNKGYPNKVNGAVGGRTARAAGGKTYRSYKDMDAGAGSGKGRLEKTEIEARKS